MSYLDFSTFSQCVDRTGAADHQRVTQAGKNLILGVQRIRKSKQTEAIGAWLSSLAGDTFRRAEAREAVVVAAEEVDAATKAYGERGERLRTALYTDALTTIGAGDQTVSNTVLIVGGVLVAALCLYYWKR